MKLLFDQNISPKILKILPSTLYDATHVKFNQLSNRSDLDIFNFAKNKNYCIVTQDADFNDIIRLKGFPPKVIWFRLGNIKTEKIGNILMQKHKDIIAFSRNQEIGLFEIATLYIVK